MVYSDPNARARAMHEAGHALYAHAHGFEVRSVDLAGETIIAIDPQNSRRDYLISRAGVALAGSHAERSLCPWRSMLSRGDQAAIDAALFLADPRFHDSLLCAAQTAVDAWHRKPATRQALTRLARLLCDAGALRGQVLTKVLSTVSKPAHRVAVLPAGDNTSAYPFPNAWRQPYAPGFLMASF